MKTQIRTYGTRAYPRGLEVLLCTLARPDLVIGAVMLPWEHLTDPQYQEHLFKACAKRLRDAWEEDNPLPLWED